MGRYVTRTRLPNGLSQGETIEDYRTLTDMLRDGRALVPNDWCPEVNDLAEAIHNKLRPQEKGNG